jgi:hypothetical protein
VSSAELTPATLALGVRPPRVAIAIPLHDQFEWHRVFESALASQSRVWGGSANLVFPLVDDLPSNELLWSLLDLFDPDLLLTHVGAIADLELVNPGMWADSLATAEQNLVSLDAEDSQRLIDDWRRERLFAAELDEAFFEVARRRLAILHGDGGPSPPWTSELNPPPYPLMDVAQLRQMGEVGAIRDVVTNEGALPQLLLTVEVGRLSSGLRAEIERLELPIGHEVLDGYLWRQEIFRRETRTGALPWALAELGVRWGAWRPPRRDSVALVVGSDPWDFTLFYALRRLRSVAYWLPDELHESEEFVRGLAMALDWAVASWGGRVVVVSAASAASRESAIRRIGEMHTHRGPLRLEAGDWRDVLPTEPSRLYEREGEGRPFSVALHHNRVPQLQTPVPRTIAADDPNNVRWMTEVRVTDWAAVRHSGLGPKVIEAGGYDTNFVRVGRDGPAYFSPNWFVLGGVGLEATVVRPTLVRLSLREQLEAALAERGWTVEQSIKGVFAEETAAKFGSFTRLIAALHDDAVRACLTSYLPTSPIGLRLEVDQRHYPEIRDFARQIGRPQAIATIAGLEERGVLARGLVLKCGRCRSTSWYGLDALSRKFVCRRCELPQPTTRERWLERDEPHWRYQLDEVVYQFLKENGDLPVLALARFLVETENDVAVDVAYELRFTSPEGVEAEIDIVAARGFELVIGEATRAERYASDHEYNRLVEFRAVVEAVEAREVVLATSRAAFHRTTLARAAAVFPSPGARLTILEGVD